MFDQSFRLKSQRILALTLNFVPLGDVQDEVNIRIVVVVGAAPDWHDVISQLDVLRVGLEVLGRDHDDKLDGLLGGGEVLVGPAPDGSDAFDSWKMREMWI